MTPMQVQPKEQPNLAAQQKLQKLRGSKDETLPKQPAGMMYGHMIGFE